MEKDESEGLGGRIESVEKVMGAVALYEVRLTEGTVFRVHSGTLKRLKLSAGFSFESGVLRDAVARSEALEARESCLRSLASRGRTAQELKRLLAGKGFGPDAVSAALEWLEAQGLLDEATLLEDTAEALLARKGVRLAEQKLLAMGFDKAAVRTVLKDKEQGDDVQARLLALARRKAPELMAKDPARWRERLGAWLYGKGYGTDAVRRTLERLKREPEDEE